ncbi:MAG: helix-turn-helix domain-containing protein, partial [Bacteroidota bacterium]
MDLRLRLIELRKSKGLTQEELAERCNISVRTIQRIESGAVQPRANTVKIISQNLGVDLLDQAQLKRYSFSGHIQDLFNLKTDKMRRVTFLSIIGVILLLSSFLVISSVNQTQDESSTEQSQGQFQVVETGDIDKERLAFATKIAADIIMAAKEGGYYKLSTSEAETRMIEALTEKTQRSVYEQVSGAFGQYKSMEFVQLVVPTDGTLYEVYRFKGRFENEKAEIEIRSV